MATCPPGAERKVMLTWENTSLDSKASERNNRSSFHSIKSSAAECSCEEKKAVATLPQFIPNRGQQDAAFLAQTAPFKPPNRATSLLGSEQSCLSALLFGLNASVTKRTETPTGKLNVDCAPHPNYCQAILSPTITSNPIITQAKKTKPIPIQQMKTRLWRTTCLVRELQYKESEKESRNVWIVWVAKMLGRTLQKTNITGGTITLVKPAGAVIL